MLALKNKINRAYIPALRLTILPKFLIEKNIFYQYKNNYIKIIAISINIEKQFSLERDISNRSFNVLDPVEKLLN